VNSVISTGLYIHFPFCRAKCSYCHFYSIPYERSLFERWRESLGKEASRSAGNDIRVDTLYIGGGTPSLLGPEEIFRTMEIPKSVFRLDLAEFTLEANPDVRDEAFLRAWKDAGVSRLSVGVQSFDDRILRILGRGYTARQAEEFLELARKAGFRTISLDLMIGIPTEKRASLRKSLRRVRELGPDHVSLYILENLEGLPFESLVRDHSMDEDAAAEAYELMRDGLEEAGLRRYEISNFAREGWECLHNLKYWHYEPFLGLGPSACSHIGAGRWCNKPDLETWASALAGGGDCREEVRPLPPEESVREALIFGLRLVRGISMVGFMERFGVDVMERYGREVRDLVEEGLILVEGDVLRIPEDKFLISNRVFNRFV
jgi:oxygen-independent coproporphyrinogen-3 oxidase